MQEGRGRTVSDRNTELNDEMFKRGQFLYSGKDAVVRRLAADLILLSLGSAVEQEHVHIWTEVGQVPVRPLARRSGSGFRGKDGKGGR